MNFSHPSPNSLQFDIYIQHTNSPTVFEYSGGQYFFNFNPLIANGGTLNYNFAGDSSSLPPNMRPRNPQIVGSQLRLAANTFPYAGNGVFMTNNGSPGTRIARMKITTTAPSMSNAPVSLSWRSSSPDPFTKIYAYIGNVNTNISSSANFLIDSSGILLTYNITLALEGLLRTANNTHNRRDTVTVFLRSAIAPYQIADSSRAVIDSITLKGTFVFRNASNGTYYLVVRHLFTLETWSKSGGEAVVFGNTYNYDFTSSISQAYGNNMVLRGTKYCLYSGNVNGDLVIDISDLSRVDNDVFNYRQGYLSTDLNGDFFVEGRDYLIIDNNRFRIASAPLYK